MITGTVNANREAILRLMIRDANGQEHERNAVVDTGFDGWLSLPPDFITVLGLRWHRFGRAVLADGSERTFNIYRGVVLWDGQRRTIPICQRPHRQAMWLATLFEPVFAVGALMGG